MSTSNVLALKARVSGSKMCCRMEKKTLFRVIIDSSIIMVGQHGFNS